MKKTEKTKNESPSAKSISRKSRVIKTLPRVALVADLRNWAFHIYCDQIIKHLGEFYDFQVFFFFEYSEIENLFLEVKDYDLIHFFWRESLYSVLADYTQYSISQKGWNYAEFLTNVVAKSNITTSIYDHLFLSPAEVAEREILFNALSIGYTTVSKRLEKIYSGISNYPQPFGAVEDGIDLEFFQPANLERLTDENKEIVIGWAGNSKWGEWNGVDHKGLETIIKPVVENLRKEGYKISGFYADRQERWIPHSEMNDYYNSIDIYICASDFEGNPNPILEAMACGIPIVTTDVGRVPQLFGKLQMQYVIPSRNAENFKAKLLELIESPEKRDAISQENLQEIKKWSWENQCQRWNEFFQSALSFVENKQLKEYRDSARQLRLELYLNQKDKIQLESKFKEVNANLQLSQSRVADLENWAIDLQDVVKNGESRIAELENWTLDLQQLIKQSDQQIKSLYREIEKTNLVSEEKIAEIQDLQELQKNLQNELQTLRQSLAMMEESKVWKLRNNWVKLKNKVSPNSKNK